MEPGSRASAGLSMPAMPAMPEDRKGKEEFLYEELPPRYTPDSTGERIGESTRSALCVDRDRTPTADAHCRSFGGHAKAERRRAAEERGRDLRNLAEHREGHREHMDRDASQSRDGGL